MANVIVLLEKTDAEKLHFGRAIDKFWPDRMLEKLKSYNRVEKLLAWIHKAYVDDAR